MAALLAEVVAGAGAGPVAGLAIDPAPPAATILDVGCGTGLIGQRLHRAGYRAIDGIDLSPAMVERAARRGCYRRLAGGIDITAPLPDDLIGRHDIVIAGGVFTVGHVPPSTLAAVATMSRPGGLLLVTTRRRYLDETDYQGVSDRLEAEGALRLLAVARDAPYTLDSTGHYWAYAVAGPGPPGPP